MFERFTDRARKVMALANQSAQQHQHEYIGTEHMLAGLLREGSGVGASVLRNLRVFDDVDASLKRLFTTGDVVSMGKLAQTPRARRAVELAIESSRDKGDNYVGTEHLLLGLIREQDGAAAQVLLNHGVTFEKALAEINALFGVDPRPSTEASSELPSMYGEATMRLVNWDAIVAHIEALERRVAELEKSRA